MDVPAAAPAVTPPNPLPSPPPVTDPAPNATGTAAGSATSASPPVTTGSASGTPASNQRSDTTLSPVVAKLFNAQEQNVQVSFQVLHNPDEVVTVFTDKSTGKEIIQFPSQALIALAEMYDKDAGKVLDKSV